MWWNNSHQSLYSEVYSTVGVPTTGCHSNNAYQWVAFQAFRISLLLKLNILEGETLYIKFISVKYVHVLLYEMKKN